MFIFMFILWLIYNGRVTVEIVLLGLVICSLLFWFLCKFMEYSPRTELRVLRNIPYGSLYFFILVYEIMKANVAVIKLTLSSKYIAEPILIHFHTSLNSDLSRAILANSITITPGTITVTMENGEYTVHCLDRQMAEGIEHSIFVRLLLRMEGKHAGQSV